MVNWLQPTSQESSFIIIHYLEGPFRRFPFSYTQAKKYGWVKDDNTSKSQIQAMSEQSASHRAMEKRSSFMKLYLHEKCFLLRSLRVCEVLLLEHLQNYVVLVDFHWLGLSVHFTDYGWADSLRIRVKRVFGLNTHGLCLVDLIQDQGSKEENISCSLGCSLIGVTKLTFIFGGVLEICNVLMQWSSKLYLYVHDNQLQRR